ncbi:MAG: hypothetical protein L0Z62_38425, partial [Gemmataceae bacterium]|nr:hypothetical protein [Gemmataceae bacterium]
MKRSSAVRAHVPTRLCRRLLRVEALESRNAPGSLAWSTGLLLAAEDPWVSPVSPVNARPQATYPSALDECGSTDWQSVLRWASRSTRPAQVDGPVLPPVATSPVFQIQVTTGTEAAANTPEQAPGSRTALADFAATGLDPETLDDLLATAFEVFPDAAATAPRRATAGSAVHGTAGESSGASAGVGPGAGSGSTPASPGPATGSLAT